MAEADSQSLKSNTPDDPQVADGVKDAAAQNELLQLLKSYASDSGALTDNKHALPEQFTVDIAKPRPEFDSGMAKAYTATNQKENGGAFIALICPKGLPLRMKAIKALQGLRHANLMALLASGTREFPELRETRFVCIFETPGGKKLSQVLRERGSAFDDRTIAQEIIAPVTDLLKTFDAAGITHGRINLDNLYWNGRLVIGECVSEPCGYSQPLIYEAPERVQCSPLGKGDGTVSADCYSLGIAGLMLASGTTAIHTLDDTAFLRELFALGSYNFLTKGRDFSDYIQDFLRGTLNEKLNERWQPANLLLWLGGKRYNLIQPSPPRDASRSFPFAGDDFAGRRALAHAMHAGWDSAGEVFKENKLERWLELSVHKTDLADSMSRVVRISGSEGSRLDKQKNEMLCRAITLLDPDGPLRMRHVSTHVDGIGTLLADIMQNKRAADLQLLAEILEADLPNFWADLHRDDMSAEVSNAIWKLQRLRISIRQTSYGGGMERCLYDLNPALGCQSPLVARYNVQELIDLLRVLDAIAPAQPAGAEVMDRHIAAFIASKLDMQGEVKVAELSRFTTLAANPRLIALKLLAKAQDKTARNIKLKGLCYWMVLRLLPALGQIRQQSVRQRMIYELKRAASTGNLNQIAQTVLNPDLFGSDSDHFHQAGEQYQLCADVIASLSDHVVINERAKNLGRGFSMLIAYCVCATAMYFSLQTYFNW